MSLAHALHMVLHPDEELPGLEPGAQEGEVEEPGDEGGYGAFDLGLGGGGSPLPADAPAEPPAAEAPAPAAEFAGVAPGPAAPQSGPLASHVAPAPSNPLPTITPNPLGGIGLQSFPTSSSYAPPRVKSEHAQPTSGSPQQSKAPIKRKATT